MKFLVLVILVSTYLSAIADSTASPTTAPTTHCESPCPSTCPAGYGPEYVYSRDGCDVFCATRPRDDQCLPGGSGCTSSCKPCQELSACPTSCPNGYVPGMMWPSSDPNYANCAVFCMAKPANGQCEAGGAGCTSSCIAAPAKSSSSSSLSTGAVVGIAVASLVFFVGALVAAQFFLGCGCFAGKTALAAQGGETTNKV